MRTEFDMMGRSESRDGWRAMSATTKVGDRDFLRFCGLELDRWVVAVFSCSEDGQISRDRLWLGRAKPHCREKGSSRTPYNTHEGSSCGSE